METNKINGTLDLQQIGLGDQLSSELASLVLSGNAGLQGMTGNFRSSCKVETVGCSLFSPLADTADGSSTSKTTSSVKSSLLVPLPTLTFTYRTLPAATFDSLPLNVEFDLYLPPTPSIGAGHPLVIWFHGGGLLQGNKENLPPHFRRLPGHKYGTESVAVISPNYRLAPQIPILDILDDVTVLLSFVRAKLNDRLEKTGESKQQIDTSRICVSGGSAGGYLALMAGLAMPINLSDEQVGGYRGDRGIKCIAPFYPITDLLDKFWATKVDPVPWLTSRHVPKRVRALSPLLTSSKHNARGGKTPFGSEKCADNDEYLWRSQVDPLSIHAPTRPLPFAAVPQAEICGLWARRLPTRTTDALHNTSTEFTG